MHQPERTGRITREPDGQWDITKTYARLLETVDPQRFPLRGSATAEGTPVRQHNLCDPVGALNHEAYFHTKSGNPHSNAAGSAFMSADPPTVTSTRIPG
jgi:hypothetical protein